MVKKGDGKKTTSFEATIEQLMAYHFRVDGQDLAHEDIRAETHLFAEVDQEFSQKEIEAVFRSANRGKAPGLYEVPMEVIELVYRANKPLFTGLLYKCLRDYAFPSSWKKADLVLFNKIDKERSGRQLLPFYLSFDSWE